MPSDLDWDTYTTALAEGRINSILGNSEYSLEDYVITRCYGRAVTSSMYGNGDVDDLFYDELVKAGSNPDEADDIVENYNG